MTWHETYLVIGTFFGIALTFVAILISRHYQKKDSDRKGMLRVYDILSNENNKKIRRRVYEAYCGKKFSDDGKILDNSYNLDIEEARTVFGEIGGLVKDGLIPKKAFLDTFAGVVIRIWKSLEQNIYHERKVRNMQRYMEAFEELYKSALEHWRIHYYPDPEPDPCGEKTKEIMENK